jgi:lipid-binding SYLF domain-containing protein
MVIPPDVLAKAKGLAIITVLKAGFLFSGRAGSGVIVARLDDGSWSAPSAIITAGAGVGGQIGAELTDFVFILNTKAAVETFSQAGSITLGGNVSLAAGPLGRNAEAAGTASMKSVAAIFSYSKTKGLFAGISLEGSGIVERREANRKFYGRNCTAKSILSGRVDPPPECDMLFRILESRAFRGARPSDWDDDDFYNDIPDEFSDSGSSGRRGGSSRRKYSDDEDDMYNEPGSRSNRRGNWQDDETEYNSRSNRRGTWQDDEPEGRSGGGAGGAGRYRSNSYREYSDEPEPRSRRKTSSWEDDVYDKPSRRDDEVDDVTRRMQRANFRSTYSDHPGRPTAAKPRFDGRDRSNSNRERDREAPPRQPERRSPAATKAVALFSFEGEQAGDLSFKKGDVISIVKKTETKDDWWTGSAGGKEGIFPANYVELV